MEIVLIYIGFLFVNALFIFVPIFLTDDKQSGD